MDPSLTTLEIIGMAVRSEEDAAKFYGHIAAMIDNDIVKEKYRNLAREEVSHKKMLEQLYQEMVGKKGAPPRIPGSPVTAEGGPIPADIAESLEELLKLAIQREQEAKAFYRRAAGKAVDAAGRRTLEYLASVEGGHEQMLKTEMEAYLRDRDWYTGKAYPHLTHVGP